MKLKKLMLILTAVSGVLHGQIIHVNPLTGNDQDSGSITEPLQTLSAAIAIVNESEGSDAITLILAPGLYALPKALCIKPARRFTRLQRLTIRAAVLPDESSWSHSAMPVIISTETPEEWTPDGTPPWLTALQFECSHVTIQGLKFLGHPQPNIWYYPISRYGKSLKDLHITQCAFVMDRAGVTSNVGVLANGHETVIDHSVFYRCRNPVVFWRAEEGVSTGNAMHHCIIHDAYTSAIWVCDTDIDLSFHHNIIDGAEYVWMRDAGSSRQYSLSDCLISGYRHYSGQAGENFALSETDSSITYVETSVLHDRSVKLVNQEAVDVPVPRFYLHVAPGTPGAETGAGLFKEGVR